MNIDATLTNLVARFAPWLAPLPTAWAIGDAVQHNLRWPLVVAVVAGAAVELVGIAATATAMELWQYNRARRASDRPAPARLGIVPVLVYVLSVAVLIVLLDLAAGRPTVVVLASLTWPALSLSAYGVLALRFTLEMLRQDAETARQERAIARKAAAEMRKAEEQARRLEDERRQRLGAAAATLDWLAAHPGASRREAAEALGVSERTIRNHIAVARRIE